MAKLVDLEKQYPGYQWRFVSWQATVKHAIELPSSTGQIHGNTLATCGNSPVWFSGHGWLGSGNQREYEKLDELRECKKCLNRLGEGKPTPTPTSTE